MKVVFLLQDTRTLYGAEVAMLRLARGLDAAGVSVRVLLLREARLGFGPSPLAEAFRGSVPVEEIPVRGRFSRRAVAGIRQVMRREQAAILHSTGYKADWHAGLASRWGREFPVVSTVHGWLFRWHLKERLYQALNLRALRRFNRVIVLCGFYERYLRNRGLSPLQIAKIPTGIRADDVATRSQARQLWEMPGEVFTFGMLGRLSAEKDHRLLLRAAARLARERTHSPRPWRILIAGEGELRADLQRRIRGLDLQDRVHLAGRMKPGEFFRQVHALIQCSRVENQPMSIMEAMAWMRPVIATRAGGLPELVRDGETGRLVQKGHAGELACAMRAYLAAPDQAAAAGRQAREWLDRDFSFDRMIADHIGLYTAASQG